MRFLIVSMLMAAASVSSAGGKAMFIGAPRLLMEKTMAKFKHAEIVGTDLGAGVVRTYDILPGKVAVTIGYAPEFPNSVLFIVYSFKTATSKLVEESMVPLLIRQCLWVYPEGRGAWVRTGWYPSKWQLNDGSEALAYMTLESDSRLVVLSASYVKWIRSHKHGD